MKKFVANIKKRYWVIGAIVLVILGVFAYRLLKPKAPPMIVHPQVKTLQKTLEVSGVVNAREQIKLRFLAGGKIVYVGAKSGDVVKKGKTIASIDARDLKKNLEKELLTYNETRMDADLAVQDTYKDVHGNKTVDQTLTKNQWGLDSEVLSVELKDYALKNTSIYAPFNGVLVSSPTDVPGTMVLATDVFQVVNPDSMFFEADIDEADINSVFVGQTVSLVLDAYPEKTIEGKVEYVAFQSSETTNGTVFKVRISLPGDNSNFQYKLGMNGTAKLLLEEKENVLSVPLTTLIERNGTSYVEIRQKNNSTVQRQIQKGIETEDDVEILSGLTESDEVVQK